MSDEQPIRKNLPIQWVIPDDLIPRYATNVVVQHTPNEFIISFFEIPKPIILGTPEQRQELVEALDRIKAKCIAQIVVSPGKMKDFLTAMEENYKRFEEGQSKDGSV